MEKAEKVTLEFVAKNVSKKKYRALQEGECCLFEYGLDGQLNNAGYTFTLQCEILTSMRVSSLFITGRQFLYTAALSSAFPFIPSMPFLNYLI